MEQKTILVRDERNVKNAENLRCDYIITSICDPYAIKNVPGIARANPRVYLALGMHPKTAGQWASDDQDDAVSKVADAAAVTNHRGPLRSPQTTALTNHCGRTIPYAGDHVHALDAPGGLFQVPEDFTWCFYTHCDGRYDPVFEEAERRARYVDSEGRLISRHANGGGHEMSSGGPSGGLVDEGQREGWTVMSPKRVGLAPFDDASDAEIARSIPAFDDMSVAWEMDPVKIVPSPVNQVQYDYLLRKMMHDPDTKKRVLTVLHTE